MLKSKEELLAIIEQQEKVILKLVDSNQLKVKWINLLVHDLRGLLANTIWFIDTFLKQEIDEKVFLELLPELKKTAELQLEGFNKTVVWTREHSTDLDEELVALDLDSIIASVLEQHASSVQAKRLTVNVSCEKKLTPFGYPLLTQFVIKHVLDNAIKFTDMDGSISIDLVCNQEKVYVEITDNGIGMNEQTLQDIYNPNKIKYLGTAGEKGIGITLFMCKDFMEMQKGQLVVQSSLGCGTRVRLEFMHAL
ncbi:HAMP domain-containing sensor histidine kinase [Olivibacter sp. XZL3]|uniref:sensor histidine kinase n=1 Tax=Olivibacter sp. XZL3 TaxID=1735116 RepID=UPI001066332E|nr:HAMP domain-containing sensor histidine kinase [Olivibacter sp. XZL3]